MRNINKIIILLIILLIITQAGLLFFYFDKESDTSLGYETSEEDLPVHYSYFSKQDFYDEAYDQGKGQVVISNSRIYGGIIPHHLIVKDKIAAFFEGLEGQKYETVVLIGPNHFENGRSRIITSEARWKTPYGYLEPDLRLLREIAESELVAIEEDPFIIEHSISGLVGFIKKSFPESKFVPIILSNKNDEKDIDQFAQNLIKTIDKEKTLVLASVDFSHYMSVDVADFHDDKSRHVIENFDYSRVYDMEIDSPSSIYTLLKYLESVDSKKADLIFATNSGVLVGKEDDPTTSHNLYYFSKGEKKSDGFINMMFFGDLMIDRHVGERIDKNGFDYLFDKLAGEENRFFKGIDLIGANLEGAVANDGNHYAPIMSYDFSFKPELIKKLQKYNLNYFTIANNHLADQGANGIIETRENLDKLGFYYSGCQDRRVDDCSYEIIEIADQKIAMMAYSMVYGVLDEEKIVEQILEIKEKVDQVVVNIHWGVEYEHIHNQTQQNLAHKMIDAGADMIIGHHPHVVQGIEVYKNKPIFYSLGNFIFDQYFSVDTQEGYAVGINMEDNKYSFYLFPYISKYSQVELLQYKNKEDFFAKIISWSSLSDDYENQLREGRFKISQ